MSAYAEQQFSLTTPSGRVVTVSETALGAIVDIIEDARERAFDEVLELLGRDYERFKDCGDHTTAETIEVMRAKVRAKRDPK